MAQLIRSPFLDASDTLAKSIDSMTLDELLAHADDLRRIATLLFEAALRTPPISSVALANLRRLIEKLQWQLDDTFSLIEDLKVQMAQQQPPPTGAPPGGGGGGAGGMNGPIAPPPSAPTP